VARSGAVSTPSTPAPDRDPGDDDPQDTSAPRGGLLGGTTRLSLFGEVGMVGVVVTVLSLPLVTAVPAVAAGALHLRRHLAGDAGSLGNLLRAVGPALRDLWGLGLLVPFVLLLTGWNLWLVSSTGLAGGPVIGAVSALVGAVTVVVALRTVGTWSPGTGGAGPVRSAARRGRADLSGSALLVVAAVLCGVLIWILEAFVLLVGGLLALAAVAVEHRWAVRTDRPTDRPTDRRTDRRTDTEGTP
jgi:hypothetical protein